jgi:hypothetical protein
MLCVYSVCVVPCVGSGLAARRSPSKESYRPCTGLINGKNGPRPNKRAAEPLK